MGRDAAGVRMKLRTRNPDTGMVYRGDPELIHVSDGRRTEAGRRVARFIDEQMRKYAEGRTEIERYAQALCPGCYMVVIYNAALALADANGQPRRELAASMSLAFAKLAEAPDLGFTEAIEVILDPCEEAVQ